MDKKYGRSERRFNEHDRDGKTQTDRRENEKRRYPRPKANRPYKNIDEYLTVRDEKFGETGGYQSERFKAFNEGKAEGNRKSRRELQREERKREERNARGNRGRRSIESRENRTRQRDGRDYDYREKRNNQSERRDYGRQNGYAFREDGQSEENPNRIQGRNAVQEAYRSGRTVDRLYIQEDLHDAPISAIIKLAKKNKTVINYVSKERLNQMSPDGKHQGVIATVAAYEYATVEDILEKAKSKGEDPFIFLLDGIEDPHNLGAIIRTANLAGAHGVIIGKHRAVGLTQTVVKASAGALNYTPVAKVTNMAATIDELKKDGMWFVCADMNGQNMYELEMKGAVGLVIGNEGTGVSRLVKEKCDFIASIPMRGDLDSLNASVAAGVLGFEIARQRGI